MNRESPLGSEERSTVPGRRELLLSLVGGLGFFAVQGPALGASLLLRPMAPLAEDNAGVTTLTRSWAQSVSLATTLPATVAWTRTSSSPKTGTQTITVAPFTGENRTFTMTYPAPGWQTQTVTVAETHVFKFTPPATNTHTISWSGNSYTITSSRTVTRQTITEMATWSHSYTTLVQDDGGDDTDGGGIVRSDVLPPVGADVRIESIDGPDLDLLTPGGRGDTRRLLFAHGRRA